MPFLAVFAVFRNFLKAFHVVVFVRFCALVTYNRQIEQVKTCPICCASVKLSTESAEHCLHGFYFCRCIDLLLMQVVIYRLH